MKRLITLALTLSLGTALWAQTPYHLDLNVTSVGRQYPVTEFTSFSTGQQALDGAYHQSPYYYSLNGTWQFQYLDNDRQALSAWNQIQVPGNWERQGYGVAIYVNQPFEFDTDSPEPPILPRDIPVGVYQRTFTVPADWTGEDIFLNLDGAKSGVYVYINDKEVGYAENSKDRARFLISDFLQEGENTLRLNIYRWSTGSWLECQDFWRISGIERDVYLTAQPKEALQDFTILSTLLDDYTTGVFHLDVLLSRHNTASFPVSYSLLDADGRVVAQETKSTTGTSVAFGDTLAQVQPWSAEKPYLYTLLIQTGGRYTPYRVGFRKFEMRGSQFFVNGQPVKFKGVNIHEHDQVTGHYVSEEVMRKDLEIMRLNNINAIRTSHYPQAAAFYRLCDEVGMYVYCEANIESHGMYYSLDKGKSLGNNRDFYATHMDRIVDMYERCKNFACVTIWSLGNEAGNGYNFYRAYEWIEAREKGIDKMNRPICYERALWEWNTDMYVPQYPSASWFERIGARGSDRPIVPSEYSHAMGNSNGGLWKQWQQIYKYPHLQGAFIWDWVDQGFLEHDAQGTAYWTYGGDYGVNTPSDANFCCNGIVNPDRTPHPAMAEVKYAYANVAFEQVDDATYNVINRFYFTTLDNYDIRYTVTANGRAIKTGTFKLSTPPQTQESLTIDLSGIPKADNMVYYVQFDAVTRTADRLIPAGHVQASDQFALSGAALARLTVKEKKGAPLSIEEDNQQIAITGRLVSFVYDKVQGVVTSYQYNGRQLMDRAFGFRPNFWRGPTDNDYGNGSPATLQIWKQSSLAFQTQATAVAQEDGVLLTATYALPAGNSCSLAYKVYPSGKVHMQLSYAAAPKDTPNLPRLGVRFRLPKTYQAFSYFGRGPMENYSDRNAGSMIGTYHTTAQDQYYPYVRPQENGHHTQTSWISFDKGLMVQADDNMEFNVLPMSVEILDSQEATSRPYQWRFWSPDEVHDPEKAQNRTRRQTHLNDAVAQDYVEVCLDYRMMGVGGYDSWGSQPDSEHLIPATQAYSWGVTFIPAP